MVGLFKMLGYAVKGALNPVTQLMVAGNAPKIIMNITGKPCSQRQLRSLEGLVESARQYKISDTKHDYAFQVLHTEFINEDMNHDWDNVENIKLLQQQIRVSAIKAIQDGLIQNSYVISLYDEGL